MVSNAIEMDLQELLEVLERLRQEQDPEYLKLRSALPEDWPI
jgi:hypothetical protein